MNALHWSVLTRCNRACLLHEQFHRSPSVPWSRDLILADENSSQNRVIIIPAVLCVIIRLHYSVQVLLDIYN